MPLTSKMAIVGIVAILHLWFFVGLTLIERVEPKPKPMTVSFVSRSSPVTAAAEGTLGAKSSVADQVDQAVPLNDERAAQTSETAKPTQILSSDNPQTSLDETERFAANQQSFVSASDTANSATQAKGGGELLPQSERDDQLINPDVLAAVNSTLQQQSGAQSKVDKALETISAAKSNTPSDRVENLQSGDDRQTAESGSPTVSKNSHDFLGIDTACPAFLHQLPVSDQLELIGSGCTLGQVQGCHLKFDRVGIKNFPAFDARSGIFEGEAVLSFTVDDRGNPTEAVLLAATTQSMGRSALKFLSTSQFVPLKDSTRCGPYALPVRFSLYD